MPERFHRGTSKLGEAYPNHSQYTSCAEIAAELAAAEEDSKASSQPARRFKEFSWSTRDSWSRQRRVIAKAEWTGGAANPRFVVTSLSPEEVAPQRLYEEIYCARGDIENRIKECQLDLFADRTSAATMRANPAARLSAPR